MLTDLLTGLADALAGVDIKATHDPQKLSLPGALLYPVTLDFDRLDGNTASVEVEVILTARGLGTTAALNTLEDMLHRSRSLWPVPVVTAVNVNLPNHSPDPLPGLRYTVTAQVTRTP